MTRLRYRHNLTANNEDNLIAQALTLPVEGVSRTFVPIHIFRETHNLPATFSLALFEPKNFTGLARIDEAGTALNQLREQVLAAVPSGLSLLTLQTVLDDLKAHFRHQLEAINPHIGLKPAELDFAVAGFADANQAFFYALVRQRTALNSIDTQAIYRQWLAESTRLSQTVHHYPYGDDSWSVQIITYAYGRVGMQVTHDDTMTYVADGIYTCPAKGYMVSLAQDLIQTIIAHLT